MPKYRVREGRTFGIDKQYSAGDVIELTEYEAAGLDHIITPVGEGFVANVEPEPEPEPPKLESTDDEGWNKYGKDKAEQSQERLVSEFTTAGLDDTTAGILAANDIGNPSYVSDDVLLAIKGVGAARLDVIRTVYPYIEGDL